MHQLVININTNRKVGHHNYKYLWFVVDMFILVKNMLPFYTLCKLNSEPSIRWFLSFVITSPNYYGLENFTFRCFNYKSG